MKVRCDRNELADCLSDVVGIVPPGQTTRPILTYFHLKTEAGHLVVEATDMDLGARIRLERVEVLEPGEVALPAARLSSLVREIQDKEVLIEGLQGGQGARVSAHGCEFKLLGADPEEFPEGPPFHEDSSFCVSRERFVEALRRVAVAASRDVSRFQLTGVFFELEGDRLILTATDGKRLTNDEIRVENPSGQTISAIVPNRAVDVLLKILGQGDPTVTLVLRDPDIQVSFGRGIMTAKVIEGAYPDYRIALSQKVASKVSVKRMELLAAAKTAALMIDRQTSTVGFDFAEDRLSVCTQASDIGESRIDVPIQLEGSGMELRFNPTFLIDALRCVIDDEVRVELTDSQKPAVVRGGQHYRHLVMPLVTK